MENNLSQKITDIEAKLRDYHNMFWGLVTLRKGDYTANYKSTLIVLYLMILLLILLYH